MEVEEIKRIAKLCLDNKWYPLIEDREDEMRWCDDCDFCLDAKEKHEESGKDDWFCNECLIDDTPICTVIEDWYGKGDKSVIVRALEELRDSGSLTLKTAEELIPDG